MSIKKLFAAATVAATIVTAPGVFAAEGTGWDYSQMTSAVDFSTITTGVLAVAGILAGVYAGIKGARIVLGFLRS